MKNTNDQQKNEFLLKKSNELLEELFNLSKTLGEMHFACNKELNEIKANPIPTNRSKNDPKRFQSGSAGL